MHVQVQADVRSLEDLAGIIERHLRSLRRDLAAHRRGEQPAPWSWTDGDSTVITVRPCDDKKGSIHITIGDAMACLAPHVQPAFIAALQWA